MMEQPRQRSTTDRPALTPEKVIDSALQLAEEEGLERISIRKLSSRLDVTPMALYWHFANKDELLSGMAERIVEGVETSVDRSSPWQRQLRGLLKSMLATLRAHPNAATLVSNRTISSEPSLRVTEVLLDILRRAGFSPAEATQIARHALNTLVHLVSAEPGVVIRDEPSEQSEVRLQAQQLIQSLPVERYPRLVEAAKPLSEGVEPDSYFAFGLDLLIAGIESLAPHSHHDDYS